MRRAALLAAAGGGLDTEPAGPNPVFRTSFEPGNFTEFQSCQWLNRNDGCQSYDGSSDYSATVVELGDRPDVARFEVRNGDIPPFGGGERAEIADPSGTLINVGDEIWYGLDVMFPADFPTPASGSGWHIIFQWHSSTQGVGGPPLTLDVANDGRLYLANENEAPAWQWTEIGPIVRGEWVRYVIHVMASPDPAVGFGEVWQDGELVLPRHSRRTMMDTAHHYLKMGVYRDPANTATSVVYFDNFRVSAA